MNMKTTYVRLLAGVLVGVAFLGGCTGNPNERKHKYFESGQRYYDKGKYREAVIQFGNAIQVDPAYADAHYQRAQAYLKLQQGRPAFQDLTRTIELQSDNYAARLDLANLLIGANEFKQAQEQTDLLLQKQPGNPLVHAAVANLLAGEGNVPAAIVEARKAVELDPTSSEAYLGLAQLELRSNQTDLAESDFKKAIALNPKSTPALLALGAYYQSARRFPEAEQQDRAAISADPTNPDPRSALVRLFIAEGKKDDAENFLKQSKQDFPDNSAGYRMLGDFYFATGDAQKATAEYASLYKAHPKDAQVIQNYVQLLILQNRLDEATRINDEILKDTPTDENALICRGQIQTREGHPSDAANTLRTVMKSDPDNATAHYHLGLALDALGSLSEAQNEWQAAARLNPNLVEPQRALAGAALRSGDVNALEQYATTIIGLQPDSPDGYALRAVVFLNRREYLRAEQDAQRAIAVAPANAAGYTQMGKVKLAQQQFGDSEKLFQQALERDPTSPDALSGLMNTYILQKQPDKAVAAARAQISRSPGSSAFYDLLGTALFNDKRDPVGATTAFQKAIELDKHDTDALSKLGQLEAVTGNTDAALATYLSAIADNPRQPDFYLYAGGLYESKEDWEHAKAMYQKALEVSPDYPLAANNLAFLILKTGGNVDVALSLAQTARRGLPNSPNVADTLGWILYQKGAYKSAIDLFQEALRLSERNKNGEDATFHYHLGLAYEKTDQPKLARQELERVLKIDPDYSEAADVKKQLAELTT